MSEASPATSGGSSPERTALLDDVARRMSNRDVVLVAIDGVDGAGKTVFADELATAVTATGRPAVRVSIDGFHRPREERYRRGRSSPDGFWLDSYDYDSFRALVVAPFRPGGDRAYRPAIRDVASDRPVDAPPATAPADAVLIVDGIFLNRDELTDVWDFSVWLHADFDVTYARMAERDGCPTDPYAAENRRYVDGQRLYLDSCRPHRRATLVIHNNDPAFPLIVRDNRTTTELGRTRAAL